MFTATTTTFGVARGVVFAAGGPNFALYRTWASAVFGILMLVLGCGAIWKGIRRGGRPADALNYACVAVIAGFISYIADPAVLSGTYGWVTGAVNGG